MLLFIVAAFVLVLDQATKVFIRYFIPVNSSYPLVPGIIHVTHVRNPGAAFGLLPNQKIIFLAVSIAVIGVIVYYYLRAKVDDRQQMFALGLLLGGAVGNVIDRLFLGKVTDFIDLRIWPVFNLADSSIVVGAIMLSIIFLINTRKEPSQVE